MIDRPEHDATAVSGAPSWVTAELIAQTIDTWQPYYRQRLTGQDALDILLGMGRLIDNLLGSKS